MFSMFSMFSTGSKFRDYSSKPAALISRDEKPACERKPDRSDRSDRFLREIGLKVSQGTGLSGLGLWAFDHQQT